MSLEAEKPNSKVTREFAEQAERLGQYKKSQEDDSTGSTRAVEAKFITAQDPVIETADGGRLPAVPLEEALKLNQLRDQLECRDPSQTSPPETQTRDGRDGTLHGVLPPEKSNLRQSTAAEAPLGRAVPPARTNPLFPPLPIYGPPSLLRNAQSLTFRVSSGILSFLFLMVVILGAIFTGISPRVRDLWYLVTFRDPQSHRQFHEEEKRRYQERLKEERRWIRLNKASNHSVTTESAMEENRAREEVRSSSQEKFVPTEGGPDPLICDLGYYARRVGLDCETFEVQTEDGFIIELIHLFNPLTTKPRSHSERKIRSPDIFQSNDREDVKDLTGKEYPVLLIHGLLQSAGAYCCSGEDSLAFFLAKSGLDVWLGNNRCGFQPRHTLLKPNDPRMWAWNIRQMGVMDLPAMISRVLYETGFDKLALVAHSQGTTQTMVALAKEQRPEIGERISIACLLAPAAYAGPLIGKIQFKFMRIISPNMFRAMFGIHSFIPVMMKMHRRLPGRLYGFMGYLVFSFLFNWTDKRWDRGLRDRFFQFSPVYVSAESMRWWLGRECFATQKCILATREEGMIEDAEDEMLEGNQHANIDREQLGRYAWYDKRVPPFAVWVGGSDGLVDGQRLLRRFERGREPFVNLVYSKVIPEYEHLDVLWAMDSIEQVGREVLECIWKTMPEEARRNCKRPVNCEGISGL
jgi:pimeloyl-ACP methyl ester carboxylesterase